MKLLKLTLTSPEANLALDEALLDLVDSGELDHDVVRLWEPTDPFVVVGRASNIAQEVNLAFCDEHKIPIRRRCSGGAAIVTAPGCLMYAIVIGLSRQPRLHAIDCAHAFVLQRMKAALIGIGLAVEILGISDLGMDGKKVSGNSLRCKRNAILYHGTLLYDGPLDLIADCLHMPPRQPDYRERRSHREFMTNLIIDRTVLAEAIVSVWKPSGEMSDWPREAVDRLTRERYSRDDWNYRH